MIYFPTNSQIYVFAKMHFKNELSAAENTEHFSGD